MYCELCSDNGDRCLVIGVYHARLCPAHTNEIDAEYCKTELFQERILHDAEYLALLARAGTDERATMHEYNENEVKRWLTVERVRTWVKAWLDERRPTT